MIIGASSAQEMGLIQLNMENVLAIATQQKQQSHKTKPMTKESVMQKYPLVFQGELGRLAGKVHLMVDETIMPTKQPVRRVPIAIKEQLQKELQRMEEMGVIAKEEQPTDWISSLVTVKKPNGKIRVCIDPKPLNRALIRSQYLMSTLEDLLPELAEARIFSVLDVRNGFWHISLDDQSSKLTAFGTPFGKYRWKRLPFGVSTAPEIFQERLNAAIKGIRGVYTVANDIFIIGKGSTEAIAREDHDKNLTALLDRCQEKGIKLNGERCQIATQKVKYMGHVLSSDGLLSDSAKIEAIQKMPRPMNVAGIHRFIGMTGYLSRFLGHLSDLCEPLRQLTKRSIQWQWNEEHQQGFDKIKAAVTQTPVLQYFDGKLPTTIQCDASQTGLGAVPMQSRGPIAYASRALTETEKQYAQIEKEMLAIVYAMEKFHTYTYGRNITIESDHKRLVTIHKKPLQSAPKRLQRMLMRLQKYSIDIQYRPGKELYLADTLSRAYLAYDVDANKTESMQQQSDWEKELEQVNMIAGGKHYTTNHSKCYSRRSELTRTTAIHHTRMARHEVQSSIIHYTILRHSG